MELNAEEKCEIINKLSKKMFRTYKDFIKENRYIGDEYLLDITFNTYAFLFAAIFDKLLIQELDLDEFSYIIERHAILIKKHFIYMRENKNTD